MPSIPRAAIPRRSLRPGRPRSALLATAAVLLSGIALATAGAHDFWLVPNAFTVAPGADLTVRGQTSSLFPTSESAVTPDRVTQALLVSASARIPIRNLSTSGTSLVLRHRPAAAGQYIVTAQLAPRFVRESPESFRRYLELEGAPEALERYGREGLLPTDSITRSYAKYAKTYVEVGTGGPRAFSAVVGHPTELIPLSDPAALRVGDTLRVQLRFHGRGVAQAHLHAGAVPAMLSRQDTAAARTASRRDVSLTADADGVVRLVIDRAGMWNVRSLHIVPAEPGAAADWDVHWATIVFQVRPGAAGEARRPARTRAADSTAAVTTVHEYHRALERGDSASALAMLAPDVMVLESGGVETRAEYRGHHLPSDIAFARAVPTTRTVRQVVVEGNTAWVSSASISQGTFNGRPVNSQGAELIVLSRRPDGSWVIRAIHWSSRNRRAP